MGGGGGMEDEAVRGGGWKMGGMREGLVFLWCLAVLHGYNMY